MAGRVQFEEGRIHTIDGDIVTRKEAKRRNKKSIDESEGKVRGSPKKMENKRFYTRNKVFFKKYMYIYIRIRR